MSFKNRFKAKLKSVFVAVVFGITAYFSFTIITFHSGYNAERSVNPNYSIADIITDIRTYQDVQFKNLHQVNQLSKLLATEVRFINLIRQNAVQFEMIE